MTDLLNNRAIDVETILGRSVAFEDAAAAVKTGFEQRLGTTFSADGTFEVENSLVPERFLIHEHLTGCV